MKKKLFTCAAVVPAAGVWGYSRRVVSIYPNTGTYKTENVMLQGRRGKYE